MYRKTLKTYYFVLETKLMIESCDSAITYM